ncbi:MAG: PilW family protein [Nitrospirota bacterium]
MKWQCPNQQSVPPTHPSPSRGEGKGEGESSGFCALCSGKGFTLVELMIAITISMIVISATYAIHISQQRSFTAQDQVAEMNSTSKIVLDMIASDVREAGFGLPEAGTYNINGFTGVITSTDSSTVPDSITLIGGYRKAGTLCSNSAGNVISPNDTQMILVPPSGYSELDNINTTDKRNISFAGLSFGIVLAGGGTTTTITLQDPIGMAYPKYTDLDGNGQCDDGEGVPVYVVEDYTYQAVGTDLRRVRRLNGGSPDTDVIAQNIEDFQVAYGVDINGNNIIESGEWLNAISSTNRLLMMRINILARTARADLNFQGQGNPPDSIENRNLTAIPDDSLRRRWWQMEVDLRNPV